MQPCNGYRWNLDRESDRDPTEVTHGTVVDDHLRRFRQPVVLSAKPAIDRLDGVFSGKVSGHIHEGYGWNSRSLIVRSINKTNEAPIGLESPCSFIETGGEQRGHKLLDSGIRQYRQLNRPRHTGLRRGGHTRRAPAR